MTEQALGTIEDETLDALEEEIAAEQALIAGEDEMPEEEEEWEVKVEDELGTNEGEAWQPGDEELPEDITPGTSGEKSIMEAMIRKKLSRRESGEAFDPTNRGTFRKVIQQDEVAGILDTSAEERYLNHACIYCTFYVPVMAWCWGEFSLEQHSRDRTCL